jgi:hypothetical protein
MIDEPIYLLDFRNQRVVEVDPATDVHIEKSAEESQKHPPLKAGITFAALGSPVDRKN